MQDRIEERARELGAYVIEHNTTVRAAAKQFHISKSTVHKDLTDRLKRIDLDLYDSVRGVLEQNKAERHIRGGLATRKKFEEIAKLTHQSSRRQNDG